MSRTEKVYFAIDLKSFYASVECIQRDLDPMTTHLVVADASRTEKTICLAVSPSLKAYGVPGRARLFEVVERVRQINAGRQQKAPGRIFVGESFCAEELAQNSKLALSYIVAPPQMALYMQTSARIYQIYLKYVAPEDIHVYSIDEVFIDATHYLNTYSLEPRDFAMKIIRDVLETTGITATAGIGTNLFLCKIAMDIEAKHIAPDKNGVRIAQLNEMSYREKLWDHQPLTDFWRVGRGYAKKLKQLGLHTMGDIARCSLGKQTDYYNEDLLYKTFGVNAELLIDHAWGWEPCTISDIKAYRPESNSIGAGQVLQCPYECQQARIIVREMIDQIALDLVDKGLLTNQVVLTVGYDRDNLTKAANGCAYRGEVTTDMYGRKVPKHAHGTENLSRYTSSAKLLTEATLRLYDRIIDDSLLVRRVYITVNHVEREDELQDTFVYEQMDLFTDSSAQEKQEAALAREKRMQKALLDIKKRYGKNAVLKGLNFQKGATGRERNNQIGGHRAK